MGQFLRSPLATFVVTGFCEMSLLFVSVVSVEMRVVRARCPFLDTSGLAQAMNRETGMNSCPTVPDLAHQHSSLGTNMIPPFLCKDREWRHVPAMP